MHLIDQLGSDDSLIASSSHPVWVTCCDCGLALAVHVSRERSDRPIRARLRFERNDDLTAALRKQAPYEFPVFQWAKDRGFSE